MGKLVRDRIPDIIRQSGKTCTTRILDEAEYAVALRDKLMEEAQEVVADGADLVAELADLWEVMDAIALYYGLDWQSIRDVQAQRWSERGGFGDRVWLSAVNGYPLP